MKYFFDTEFHEYSKKTLVGKPINTIELISIGMVAEDGREYYSICQDFDLKSAWKNDWLKENVLLSIFKYWQKLSELNSMYEFNFKNFKNFLDCYGKPSYLIKYDILIFTLDPDGKIKELFKDYFDYLNFLQYNSAKETPDFYAYFADYDWVVFCWLFGTMINLPKGFPMYCKDLRQMLQEQADYELPNLNDVERYDTWKKCSDFPEQENEHDALDNARWNLKLYKFIKK